jgi:hypothetical protein
MVDDLDLTILLAMLFAVVGGALLTAVWRDLHRWHR